MQYILLHTFATRIFSLSLALQGGGSHGAITWGVLDRLLQEPGLKFEAISGTSSGGINATVLAQRILDGGREGDRAGLADDGFDAGASVPDLSYWSYWALRNNSSPAPKYL